MPLGLLVGVTALLPRGSPDPRCLHPAPRQLACPAGLLTYCTPAVCQLPIAGDWAGEPLGEEGSEAPGALRS